jgi:hypothetical protein
MRYRVYIGPRGAEPLAPARKDQYLFKEFTSLDDAFAWARHVDRSGRVTLAIDGDDGTSLTRREVSAALNHADDLGHAA